MVGCTTMSAPPPQLNPDWATGSVSLKKKEFVEAYRHYQIWRMELKLNWCVVRRNEVVHVTMTLKFVFKVSRLFGFYASTFQLSTLKRAFGHLVINKLPDCQERPLNRPTEAVQNPK